MKNMNNWNTQVYITTTCDPIFSKCNKRAKLVWVPFSLAVKSITWMRKTYYITIVTRNPWNGLSPTWRSMNLISLSGTRASWACLKRSEEHFKELYVWVSSITSLWPLWWPTPFRWVLKALWKKMMPWYSKSIIQSGPCLYLDLHYGTDNQGYGTGARRIR